MSQTRRLRELLSKPGMLVAPGVGDALGARIVAEAGFDVVYISGFCIEASYGMADMGMLTMTEVTERAASVTAAVDLPVLCDADTGYGNSVNVIRTVKQFERAGIAGIHLEDQSLPKKCGALPDRALVSTGEMMGKIKAAVDARTDPDFLIIARTDAVQAGGMPETIERGFAYLDAGADMVMVQIPRNLDELRESCQAFNGKTVLTISESKVAPVLPFKDLEEMGLKLGLIPLSLTFAAITAMRKAIRQIKEQQSIVELMSGHDSFDTVLKLVGLDEINAWSARYGEQPVPRPAKA